MAIRTDRLTTVTSNLADLIDELDPTPMLSAPVLTALKLLKRLARIDLVQMGKGEARSWLTSLPTSASSDPVRAAAVVDWLSALLEWLRGDTDTPPPDLEL